MFRPFYAFLGVFSQGMVEVAMVTVLAVLVLICSLKNGIRLKIPAVSFNCLSPVLLNVACRHRYRFNSAYIELVYHCQHRELTIAVPLPLPF